ncbi:MAG: two pore domain potassium channel family protein [Cyanobacteria bacterium HKST-UBA03]|nr:two pore domain potassium channel family protein [Cyanobacteria bacterium HKST-UBA03]
MKNPVQHFDERKHHYRSHRFIVLLAGLIFILLAQPISELMGQHGVLIQVLYILLIFLTVYGLSDNKQHMLLGLVLGIPSLTLNIIGMAWPSATIDVWNIGLLILFNLYVIAQLFQRVLLHTRAVSMDVLNGVASIYLLMGITWALLYMFIEVMQPGSIGFSNSKDAIVSWSTMIYYSFTALTTLGFGDVVPQNALTRILAVIEASIGVLYLAITIARLDKLYDRRS